MGDKLIETLKKNMKSEHFFPNILVPLLVLALYFGSFLIFISRYLTSGVNYFFILFFLKYLIFVISGLVVAHFIYYLIFIKNKHEKLVFNRTNQKFSFNDIFLLLLPLVPVMQYVLNNLDIVGFQESFKVLIYFVLFSGLYIYVFPVLFARFFSLRTTMSFGLSFAFTITSMAALSKNFGWYLQGNFLIQVIFFLIVFFIIWILFGDKTKKILYIIILVNFAISSISPFISKDVEFVPIDITPSYDEHPLVSSIDGKTPLISPNIYLLVYESYVPNETMVGYGIDNSKQEDYLQEQGFTIYPNTYTVGSPTVDSMSRVFNASSNFYGYMIRSISGDGVVHNLLNDFGYKTIGLFPDYYMFQGVGSSYNVSYPETRDNELSSSVKFSLAILSGEFRDKLVIKGNNPSHQEYFESKQKIFNEIAGDQVFLYTHSDLPGHAEGLWGCLPNEKALYQEDLKIANLEMRQDVNSIIENDPEAIIIIAGDHGPYLTKNCFKTSENYRISEIDRLDIQDRFSTFLAIKWPAEDFELFDEVAILQDLFPAIFSYMFKDETILEVKIEPEILTTEVICGATVKNGIIYGGINDGEPLFLSDN